MESLLLQLNVALALTSATTLLLGLFVYFSKGNKQIGRVFFFYCLSISWWSFFQIWHQTSPDSDVSRLAAELMTAGGSFFIPTLFVHFVIALLGLNPNKKLLPFLYSLSVLFGALSFTRLMVGEISPEFYLPNFFHAGPLYYLGVVFFVACILYGHFHLYRSYLTSKGLRKNQLAYLFWSSLFGYVGGGANFLFVFGINIPVLSPFGTYAIPLYVAATTYSIVRYHLMEISFVLRRSLAYVILLGLIFIPLSLFILASERATVYSLPPLIASMLILICGLWIFLKNPRAGPNVTFSLVCFGVFGWLFSSFILFSSADPDKASLWGKFSYVGVVFIPAFFYHFSVTFLQRQYKKYPIILNYLLSTFFFLLIPTSLIVDGTYHYYWGFYTKSGVFHPAFLLYFASVSGVSLKRLYDNYRRANVENTHLEAIRGKYIFWAFVIGYCASIDFVQNYGFEFYPFGFVFVSLWVLIVTYAVVKYQLLDITLILNKARLVRAAQFLGLVPLYFILLGSVWLFTGSPHYLLAGFLIATLPLFSGYVKELQGRMETIIGKTLFRRRYDAYDTLKLFSKALVNMLDLKDLNGKIISTLSDVMQINEISVFLLDREKNGFILSASHLGDEGESDAPIINSGHPLIRYLEENDQILIKEEMEHWLETIQKEDLREVVNGLSMIRSELCVPLKNKDQLIGFLSLGYKTNHSMYTTEDINLLSTLGQNAAIALDNAILYEDLKRQKMLMRRTDRMRSLETMAGGFAHEIRNPLTSIKTFVQLAPQRRDDEEFVGTFSKVVSEDVSRIERLIQEILDYARYMQPRLSEEDLNDVVESSLYFIGVKADGRGITIEKSLAQDLPRVLIDRQQIKQVLLNLFLNALDAMSNSGKLIVKTHLLDRGTEGGWVQIEIGDTGSGITSQDLEHIFDPFFTTKHESAEREGTGLGLSIVHQIVQEHRGYIEVESRPNEGTTFFVTLPVNPIRHERRTERMPVS